MRKFVFVLAAATALGAGVAFANTIENAVGNTLTVTQEGAPAQVFHFNADHTFTATAGSEQFSGSWEVVGAEVCVTPQGGERQCEAFDMNKNVGDTWTQTASEGGQVTVSITPGR